MGGSFLLGKPAVCNKKQYLFTVFQYCFSSFYSMSGDELVFNNLLNRLFSSKFAIPLPGRRRKPASDEKAGSAA